ncbi:hypothetical protein, partial [Robiginitalea aurantiaca]|nr:hypothetical protein [Robiginitalea aurantiaca]
DLATLSPVITLSDGAQVSPASEIPTDFSAGPVNYLVTAEDGATTQSWTVSVTRPPFEAFVNFQDNIVTPPSPYLPDFGLAFGNAANEVTYGATTYTYGWKLAADDTPFDASNLAPGNDSGVGRNRLTDYSAATNQE